MKRLLLDAFENRLKPYRHRTLLLSNDLYRRAVRVGKASFPLPRGGHDPWFAYLEAGRGDILEIGTVSLTETIASPSLTHRPIYLKTFRMTIEEAVRELPTTRQPNQAKRALSIANFRATSSTMAEGDLVVPDR